MLSPAETLGIPVRFYSLDAAFAPADDLQPENGDWVLAVNYFGLVDNLAQSLMERFNPQQIVWDHSQAFFSAPQPGLATIYSPRKFFGVPDGGMLAGAIQVDIPRQRNQLLFSALSIFLFAWRRAQRLATPPTDRQSKRWRNFRGKACLC